MTAEQRVTEFYKKWTPSGWASLPSARKELLELIRQAESAAREEQREKMDCGHPKACQYIEGLDLDDPPKYGDPRFVCSVCAELKRVVESLQAAILLRLTQREPHSGAWGEQVRLVC